MDANRIAYLRIKISSLAAEARLIRKAEARHKRYSKMISRGAAKRERDRATWLGLKDHRRFAVRIEARAAQLAYGFVRDVPYRSMEAKCYTAPDWDRVAKIVQRFGLSVDLDLSKVDISKIKEALKGWRETPTVDELLEAAHVGLFKPAAGLVEAVAAE